MYCIHSLQRLVLSRILRVGLLSILMAYSAHASLGGEACTNTVTLELSGSSRSYGASGIDFFDVEVPTMGYLAVQVVTPLDVPGETKITLVDEDCVQKTTAVEKLEVIDRFSTGFVLEVRAPGTYRFGVAASDPRQLLREYKVWTGFVGRADLLGNKSTEDPNLEPDPIREPSTEDPNLEPDPIGEPGTEDPNLEPDPIGNKSWCLRSAVDDHGDTFLCASPLIPGASWKGELTNPWNDDRDVFTFALTEWQTVEIEISGAAGLGALYDSHAHRLKVDDTDPEDGLRFVATLAPGRYFVAVEGANAATGKYTLRLATSSR